MKTFKILYVDDNKDDSEKIEKSFGEYNVSVDVETNALKAVHCLGFKDYDYVLVSLNLPLFRAEKLAGFLESRNIPYTLLNQKGVLNSCDKIHTICKSTIGKELCEMIVKEMSTVG
jgi:CheY-like chemotaxis protein